MRFSLLRLKSIHSKVALPSPEDALRFGDQRRNDEYEDRIIRSVPEHYSGYTLITSANSGNVSNSSTATTAAVDATGANLIVLGVATDSGGAPTITDSSSNSWGSPVAGTDNGLNSLCHIYLCYSPTVTSSWTCTVTHTGYFPVIACLVFSGSTASPFDQSDQNTTAGAATLTTGSITPGFTNELLVAAIGFFGVNFSDTTCNSVDSSFTLQQTVTGHPGLRRGLGLAYQLQTAITARNPQFTLSQSTDAVAAIASFKAASVSPVPNIVSQAIKAGCYY
jgi:hypothetical protein